MVMWRYAERLRRLSTLDATAALNRAGLEMQGKRRMFARPARAAQHRGDHDRRR
jgi:hypothetical protein